MYLILPIIETPDMDFYIEPTSSNRTVLSGFLEDNGLFLIEVLPYNKGGDLFLTLSNVQFPIYKSPDEESFGYYELRFDKTKENIPAYINNFIKIDEIRVVEKNLLYSNPITQQEGRDTLVLSSNDEKLNVYISREERINGVNVGLIFVMGFLILVDMICIDLRNEIFAIIQKNKRHKVIIRICAGVAFVVMLLIYPLVMHPNKYYTDLTMMGTYVTALLSVALVDVLVFLKTLDHDKSNKDKGNSGGTNADKNEVGHLQDQ